MRKVIGLSLGAMVAMAVALATLFSCDEARADEAHTRELYSVDTTFNVLTPNDKIVVYTIPDPLVTGVVCHVSAAKTGGAASLVGMAEDTSDASVACRQVGPIIFNDSFQQGDDAFTMDRSIFMKTMHLVRICDPQYNVLVYMTYSDKLIDGSPKNAISSVPIMPWGENAAPSCAEFME